MVNSNKKNNPDGVELLLEPSGHRAFYKQVWLKTIPAASKVDNLDSKG